MIRDYDLQLRHDGRNVGEPITHALDLDNPEVTDARLSGMLLALIVRVGGDINDVALFDLQVRRHGDRVRIERTFTTFPGELP